MLRRQVAQFTDTPKNKLKSDPLLLSPASNNKTVGKVSPFLLILVEVCLKTRYHIHHPVELSVKNSPHYYL